MTEHTPTTERQVGYVYKLTTILGEGQQLELTGNMALDAEPEDMNRQFDKITGVMDRLSAKHLVVKKRGDIAGCEAQINSLKFDIKSLDETVAEKYKDRKLPTMEENNRHALVRNVRVLEDRLAGYKVELADLEKKAA